MNAHVQGVATYEGRRTRDLRILENGIYGNMRAYTQVDLSAGVESGPWDAELYAKNVFDGRGQTSKNIQCLEITCGDPDMITPRGGIVYTTYTRPRTIGLKAGYKF